MEGFVIMDSHSAGLSLPKNWPQGVKNAVLHVVALARVAIIHARTLARSSHQMGDFLLRPGSIGLESAGRM